MCRPPEQRGARRASARSLARRLHHENPRKIGRLRRHHRLRPDRRRSLRRALFRYPARYRPRHSAPRGHLRQTLRQQGQSCGGEGARHSPCHSAQSQRARQTSLLRKHPLQGALAHRTGRRTAQTLQTRRTALRKDSPELQINRKFRRRPLLDQIRPHDLVAVATDLGVNADLTVGATRVPGTRSSLVDAMLGTLGHRVRTAALDFASRGPSVGICWSSRPWLRSPSRTLGAGRR